MQLQTSRMFALIYSLTYRGDDRAREEEGLAEAPVGDVLGGEGDAALAVPGHSRDVGVQLGV